MEQRQLAAGHPGGVRAHSSRLPPHPGRLRIRPQPPTVLPTRGYRVKPEWVVKRVTYEQTQGHAPPYLIYADHDNHEIVLAIRGLNLVKESDYKLLLDNRLGMQMFDGGYVHHGLLKSATWLLAQESETLERLWVDNGRCYRMVFAGHSLGSGVAALLTVIVVNHRDRLGDVPRSLVSCYALAPARCMSLNLAVKYADVIHSVILQPCLNVLSTACPAIIWGLPEDTFIPEGRKLRDPRRLFAPGRMYHIVERKFCRCGRYPPEVRTAIPVDGRFEQIVLSCNATSDHGIIWIEREADKALQRMKEMSSETRTTAPKIQKLERLQTIEKEHKDALERAVSLKIPHATTDIEDKEESSLEKSAEACQDEIEDASQSKSAETGRETSWDEVVKKALQEK
ncbi:hypothetical protein CK203_079840 [Vitis vinifera]|uniref:Fungal lipase-type domain-containing protein n=1 Tax=Vitis vinifera TaxID=29760 RepID=A0A438DHY5_VITVI|nr:hypothetical protein CK203_079840 [Vitis vinifera]